MNQAAWVRGGGRASTADDGGDAPHPVYMPSSAERLREQTADDVRPLTDDERDAVAPAAHSNPFQRPKPARATGSGDEIPDVDSVAPADA